MIKLRKQRRGIPIGCKRSRASAMIRKPLAITMTPVRTREWAPEEIERCLTKLKMKGVGEIFIRSLTNEIHPERIANDLDGLMKVVSKHGAPIQFPTAWSQFPGGLFYGDPLWVDEVALRHPKVPIILTKMGRSVGRYFDSAMTVAMR